MSTEILTTITVYILMGGLNVALFEALYNRQLAKASVFAAAEFAALHITFVMSAWKEYGALAWAAIVFLTTGIVLAAIQQHRKKVAEKKLMKYLTHSLGVNEPEENESEKD